MVQVAAKTAHFPRANVRAIGFMFGIALVPTVAANRMSPFAQFSPGSRFRGESALAGCFVTLIAKRKPIFSASA
jgi:hypothetical protein